MQTQSTQQITCLLSEFKENLCQFSTKHAKELETHAFRHHFHSLCSSMSVDVHLLDDFVTRTAVRIVDHLKRSLLVTLNDLYSEIGGVKSDVDAALDMLVAIGVRVIHVNGVDVVSSQNIGSSKHELYHMGLLWYEFIILLLLKA